MPTFHRYDGHETAEQSIRMPADELDARTSRLSIGELIGHFEVFCNEKTNDANMFPWATRFAMGYPLPSWQRKLVWTHEQNVRFILSIWAGVDLGSYLVNESWELIDTADGKSHYREFSEALLDGQQRLTALEQYITNQFAVPNTDGTPVFWKDLPKVERRRFTLITFTKATITSWDEGLLRKVYDLRSFGGTEHTEDERAILEKLSSGKVEGTAEALAKAWVEAHGADSLHKL